MGSAVSLTEHRHGRSGAAAGEPPVTALMITGRQTDRQTDRQTCRQTYRQTSLTQTAEPSRTVTDWAPGPARPAPGAHEAGAASARARHSANQTRNDHGVPGPAPKARCSWIKFQVRENFMARNS
jgi:hypothetical protein